MEKCYYAFSPDGDFMLWSPGDPPSLSYGPREVTGDSYTVRRCFEEYAMIHVPWEAVMIAST